MAFEGHCCAVLKAQGSVLQVAGLCHLMIRPVFDLPGAAWLGN